MIIRLNRYIQIFRLETLDKVMFNVKVHIMVVFYWDMHIKISKFLMETEQLHWSAYMDLS